MASRYSITLVVGSGIPGHAAVQINGPDHTTYAGLGPVEHLHPRSAGQYDVVTLPNGESPVGRLNDPENEYSFVDSSYYPVKSYTFEISEKQALDAHNAALDYRRKYPNYNVATQAVCTDYALAVLHAAMPDTDLSRLSRAPWVLQRQLDEAAGNGSVVSFPMEDGSNYKYSTFLPHFAADARPPNFSTPPKTPKPPTPAFRPDAAYSPTGEFYGNFLDGATISAPSQEPAPSFRDRFGDWPAPPNSGVSVNRNQTPPTDGPSVRPERHLGRRLVDGSGRSVFDTGAAAAPFVSSSPLAPQPPGSFDARYGKSGASPNASMPLGSFSTGPSRPPSPVLEVDPRNAHVPRSRVVQPGDTGSGQPAAAYPAPPIFGLPDSSAASGDDMGDWFARWVRPLIRQ